MRRHQLDEKSTKTSIGTINYPTSRCCYYPPSRRANSRRFSYSMRQPTEVPIRRGINQKMINLPTQYTLHIYIQSLSILLALWNVQGTWNMKVFTFYVPIFHISLYLSPVDFVPWLSCAYYYCSSLPLFSTVSLEYSLELNLSLFLYFCLWSI